MPRKSKRPRKMSKTQREKLARLQLLLEFMMARELEGKGRRP